MVVTCNCLNLHDKLFRCINHSAPGPFYFCANKSIARLTVHLNNHARLIAHLDNHARVIAPFPRDQRAAARCLATNIESIITLLMLGSKRAEEAVVVHIILYSALRVSHEKGPHGRGG